MGNNLIPQKRLDKTGKMVTRHVLAAAPVAAGKPALPAPAMGVAPKKKKPTTKKPLAKQLESQIRMTSMNRLTPDPEVLEALGVDINQAFPLVVISASDAEMYDMFSVVGSSNAAVLLSYGKKTPEEAIELLEGNGLGRLLVDRREMMDEAVSRRISAWNFMEAPHKFNVDELSCEPEQLLGAVRLDDSTSMPRWKVNEVEDSYAHQVIRGNISYDDVMEMGLSFLSEHGSLAQKICGYLNDIHEGRTDYDVDLLVHLVSKCRDGRATLDDAMGMVSEYGTSFMKEVKGMDSAMIINREYRERPTSQRADMIRYAESGGWQFLDFKTKEIVRLFDADIPVDAAKEMAKQKMSVDQMIAAQNEGIAKAVVSGWL